MSDAPVHENSLRQPRNRSYAVVGAIVVIGIVLALVLGVGGFVGPNVFPQDVGWLVAICLFALAVGVLWLLFSLRTAMRGIREQAVAIARLEREKARPPVVLTPRAPTPVFHETPEPAPKPALPTRPVAPVAASVSAPVAAPVAVPVMVSMYTPVRASRSVDVLEGIGPVYQSRLAADGITTLDDLRASNEERIEAVVNARTPVAHQWKSMADLMILNGVTAQAAELLVRSGCESIGELARCSPKQLHRDLIMVNRSHAYRIYPETLHLRDVESWVRAAKTSDRRDAGWTSSPVVMPSPVPL